MSEHELKRAFGDLTSEVRPEPDPYARLMNKAQRHRKVRVATWTTALAGGLAMLMLGPVGLQGIAGLMDPRPNQSAPSDDGALINQWTRGLLDAPVRGALASDTAFLNELTTRLADWDFGPMAGHPVKILFAEDLGAQRVVVAARYSDDMQSGIYVTGPAGATAEFLSDESAQPGPSIAIWPLVPMVTMGFTVGIWESTTTDGVVLVPPGCAIASRALDSAQWVDAPTGDWMRWLDRPEMFVVRVTCAGTVRYEGSFRSQDIWRVHPSNMEELEAIAMAGARSTAPFPHVSRLIVNQDAWPRPTGPARVLYTGPIPGNLTTAPVGVSITPAQDGTWLFVGFMEGGGGFMGITSADIGRPDVVLVIDSAAFEASHELVIAPPGAVRVEFLDENGNVLRSGTLENGIGGVLQPDGVEEYQVRAYGPNGEVVGTGQVPLERGPAIPGGPGELPVIDNWG